MWPLQNGQWTVLPLTSPKTQKLAAWEFSVHWAKHFVHRIAWIWTRLTCHLVCSSADGLPSSKFLLSWQMKIPRFVQTFGKDLFNISTFIGRRTKWPRFFWRTRYVKSHFNINLICATKLHYTNVVANMLPICRQQVHHQRTKFCHLATSWHVCENIFYSKQTLLYA